jgi:DNA-binding LacI/PurR family transcriptional regulator
MINNLYKKIYIDKNSGENIDFQIFNSIKKLACAGKIEVGASLPAERNLSEKLGVNRQTVRKAYKMLKDCALVERNSSRRLVLSAGGLSRALLPMIGVVLPLEFTYFSQVGKWRALDYVTGMLDVASAMQACVHFIAMPDPDVDSEKEIENWLIGIKQNTHAIVHMGMRMHGREKILEKILQLDLPQAIVAGRGLRYNENWADDFSDTLKNVTEKLIPVHCDEYHGIFQTCRYLSEIGHKKICVLGKCKKSFNFFYSDSFLRFENTRKALKNSGIEIVPLMTDTIDESGKAYEKELGRIMDLDVPPSAFICHNDYMAFGVIRRLQGLGYSVPENVSVIGFDDIPMAAMFDIPLTTIAHPRRKLGRIAVETLLKILRDPSALKNPEITPKTSFIMRSSTSAHHI